MYAWILPTILAAMGVLLALRYRRHLAERRAWHAEYWVYLPTETVPTQEAIMERLVRGARDVRPVPAEVALLLSDVRLDIAVVRAARNRVHFSLENFGLDVISDLGEHAVELARPCPLFVRLKFASASPVPDKRHVRFLSMAALAYADLGDARLVRDLPADRFWTPDAFRSALNGGRHAGDSGAHVTVRWRDTPDGGTVSLRGFEKIGLGPMQTVESPADARTLLRELLEAAAEIIWQTEQVPETLEIERYGDRFQVLLRPRRDRTEIRVMRHHGA
ncbi:MAG: hypothetical protein SFX74_03865 [Fimbriimonadaceae bacterium]|nr:hypothetical protein [Fimbriimonadaceae bacterium]